MSGKENPEVTARAHKIMLVLRASKKPLELTDLRIELAKIDAPATDREADKALQYLRRNRLVEFQKRHPPIMNRDHETEPAIRERGWILSREGRAYAR